MKRREFQRPRQVVSEEVVASLLGLIQRKFYEGRGVDFTKDRKRILRWVIFWPAKEFFSPKAVSLPNDRYLDLLTKVIMDAAAFQTGPVKYVPAWLGQTMQRHFAHHGEAIYEEAKSVRTLAEHSLSVLGKLPVGRQDDVVSRFTTADRLLATAKSVGRAPRKQCLKEQLSLL